MDENRFADSLEKKYLQNDELYARSACQVPHGRPWGPRGQHWKFAKKILIFLLWCLWTAGIQGPSDRQKGHPLGGQLGRLSVVSRAIRRAVGPSIGRAGPSRGPTGDPTSAKCKNWKLT